MGAYGVDSQERDLLPSHSSRRDIRHVCPDVFGRRRCHFLSLAERFCDALLMMHQGICVEQGAMGGDPASSEGTLSPPSARSRWRRIKEKSTDATAHYDGICAFCAPYIIS